MYGTHSGLSYGLVAGPILLVVALAILASPLLAVVVALVAAVFLLIGMSALRQRSAAQDSSDAGASDTRAGDRRGRGRGPGRASGEPASGEG